MKAPACMPVLFYGHVYAFERSHSYSRTSTKTTNSPRRQHPAHRRVFCIFAAVRLTGPHTSAWPLTCSRPRLRCACPSGKLHSAAAPHRTPCSLCRRNSSFPAVQWMQWGASAPWKQGEASIRAYHTCHILHRARKACTALGHISRSGGGGAPT